MYALESIDVSDRLGIVVSEPAPDEMETLEAKRSVTLSDLATAKDLEVAVFAAA